MTYAFEIAHTYDHIQIGNHRGLKYPLWLVAWDPFADVETDKEGYIVHMGSPRFTAKWYVGEEPVTPADVLHGITYDQVDLEISLCELVFLDEAPETSDLDKWLKEACFAIAHYRGDVAAIEPDPQ